MGLQASITQSPRNANVYNVLFDNVYFTGAGASEAARQRYIDVTRSSMSGTFIPAGITVNTSVNVVNRPVEGGITVKILPGNVLGNGDNGIVRSAPGDFQSLVMTIPAGGRSDTIPHENFHMLCPSCAYAGHGIQGSGIMNSSSAPESRVITSQPFLEAYRNAGTGSLPGVRQDASPFGDFGFGGGASGGFLLYPNKPNNNQMIGVYRK